MPTARVLRTAIVLAAIYASTTNCIDILVPCEAGGAFGTNKKGFLDDIWTISTVNGSPLPAKGFPIPNSKTNDNLRGGSIELKTREKTGKCDDIKSSSGVAIANYLLADSNGQPKFPGSSAAGSFSYDVFTKLLTLTAFNKSVPGFTSANETKLTFLGPVLEDGIPSLITLVFVRAGF